MSNTFYIHSKYRFDGPILQQLDNDFYFFNTENKKFDDKVNDKKNNPLNDQYDWKHLESTTVELLIRLVPDSYYKDQFIAYLKENFYEEILE